MHLLPKSQNSPKTFYKLKETRSNLRKKPSVYLYVHAKEYTQNTICSVKLHKKKKGYILEKLNWDSVRYYALNAQVDFMVALIYFYLEQFYFIKKLWLSPVVQ